QRLGVVAFVLGTIGAIVAGRHAWHFARPSADARAFMLDHMIGMLSSYIATVTAFSVVNFTFLPPVARWLWPTLVGTPLVTIWVSYYKAGSNGLRPRRPPSGSRPGVRRRRGVARPLPSPIPDGGQRGGHRAA